MVLKTRLYKNARSCLPAALKAFGQRGSHSF
jgi:hypothetical protein